MDWTEVVTHEMLHAQYFNDDRYRAIADEFWATQVPDSEKASVRRVLGEHYDPSDELLMKNEFQAYMLMSGAEFNLLGHLVSRYREPLMARMRAAGIQPLQIQ